MSMSSKKVIKTESKNTESYERLVNRVTEKYDSLSDRNKQVARYLTQNLLRLDYEKILLLTAVIFRGDYPTAGLRKTREL
jgi:hypothetical protein